MLWFCGTQVNDADRALTKPAFTITEVKFPQAPEALVISIMPDGIKAVVESCSPFFQCACIVKTEVA